MADPARLLAEEAEAWASLRTSIDAADPSRREEPTVTPEGWSVTDTIVHVTWWLDECTRVLEAIGAGSWDPAAQPVETPSYVAAVNAAHVEASRGISFAEADGALVVARDRVRTAFAALEAPPPDAWSWFEESGPLHYAKHDADLRSWTSAGRGRAP